MIGCKWTWQGGLLIGAVVANGLLAGASLDQSIKQLPAPTPTGKETP